MLTAFDLFSGGGGFRQAAELNKIKTIAHLDHNPQNNDPKNLRALCQRCHNRYDIKHRISTRKNKVK